MSETTLDKTVLLLVGRTGNGKSSIGNILGNDNVFKIKQFGDESLEKECASKSFQYQGQSVTIVDGVSIHDTDYENDTCIKKNVEECLLKCGNYVTAILIALRFGFRFTDQEKRAIQLIKSLFGSRSIEQYGIIVLSYGDNFHQDISIDKWLNEQAGDIKNLIEEVSYRCVLFDNKYDQDPQKVQLFDILKTFRKNKPYERGLFLLHDKMTKINVYENSFNKIKKTDLMSTTLDKNEIKTDIVMLNSLLGKLERFREKINLISDTNKISQNEAEKNSYSDFTSKEDSGITNKPLKYDFNTGDCGDNSKLQNIGIAITPTDFSNGLNEDFRDLKTKIMDKTALLKQNIQSTIAYLEKCNTKNTVFLNMLWICCKKVST